MSDEQAPPPPPPPTPPPPPPQPRPSVLLSEPDTGVETARPMPVPGVDPIRTPVPEMSIPARATSAPLPTAPAIPATAPPRQAPSSESPPSSSATAERSSDAAPTAMPTAAAGPGVTDPHSLGVAVERMSAETRAAVAAAVAVVAVSLDEGEVVQCAVGCRFRGADGAAVLTEHRLLVANARPFEPDVVTIGLEPGLGVQGWQDGQAAALVFERNGHELVVDRIIDRDLARELTTEVRRRVER